MGPITYQAIHKKQLSITSNKFLSSNEILALYNPKLKTIVSADAYWGQYSDLRHVVYWSRALTATEQKYAQIEKETLASTWACKRFWDYLISLHFYLETDHKPLVPLLSSKIVDEIPLRI